MKRVMLYMRVSTDHQVKNGESLQDQRDSLHTWCAENDAVILGEYVDAGISGAKDYSKRPEFCKMLADADVLHPDLIIFTRLDRFTRNPRDYYNVDYTFRQHNIEWLDIKQGHDNKTASGQAMIGMSVVFGKLERDYTSERIKATFVEKRARGELCSGKLPKGYMIQDKKPVKNPETEAGVNAFWRTYLSGAGLKASMNAAALHGVRFAGPSSASHLLRNARSYAGMIQGIQCEPYLTEEECSIILSQRKTKIKQTGFTFLFRGLIKCAECGGNFGAHRNKYRNKNTDGIQIYYNCTRHYGHEERCSCKVNIYESDIESYLLKNLQSSLDQYNIYGQGKQQQKEDRTTDMLGTLEVKRKRLVDAYVDGLITREDFSKRCNDIDNQIEILKQSSTKLIQKIPALKLPADWETIYASLDREHKRAFWFQTLKEITIHNDRSISFEFIE